MKIVNERQSLSADDAVKDIGAKVVAFSQVGNQGRLRVARCTVQDITLDDAAAKLSRIGVVGDLHDVPLDACRMECEKVFNVIAVNRQAPIGTPVPADRLKPAKIAEAHFARNGSTRQPAKALPRQADNWTKDSSEPTTGSVSQRVKRGMQIAPKLTINLRTQTRVVYPVLPEVSVKPL